MSGFRTKPSQCGGGSPVITGRSSRDANDFKSLASAVSPPRRPMFLRSLRTLTRHTLHPCNTSAQPESHKTLTVEHGNVDA